MNPNEYAVNFVPSGNVHDVVQYYATCSGSNPLDPSLESAFTYTTDLYFFIGNLTEASGPCPSNPYLESALVSVESVYGYLEQIAEVGQCPPILQEINDSLHHAICYNIFIGLYITWLAQFITSGNLFVLLMISSVVYQYFGRFWGMNEEDLEHILHEHEQQQQQHQQYLSAYYPDAHAGVAVTGSSPALSPSSGNLYAPSAYSAAVPVVYDVKVIASTSHEVVTPLAGGGGGSDSGDVSGDVSAPRPEAASPSDNSSCAQERESVMSALRISAVGDDCEAGSFHEDLEPTAK